MYEAEAKERQREAGRLYGENHPQEDVQIIEQALTPEPKSIQKAATAFGVNRQYIADIKRIEKEAPEVFKKIEQGKISIPEAKREVAAAKLAGVSHDRIFG